MKIVSVLNRAFVLGAMVVCASASPAVATSIDFTTGAPNANQGLSYVVNADLTLTAKSGLASTDDPLFVSGKTGTIYWGDLGSLDDSDCGMNCVGIGVQNADLDMNGNLNPGGSKGISGEGGDQNEAVVFNFANNNIDANSVKVGLVGLNTGMNGDVVDLYLEFYPSTTLPNSDKIFLSTSFVATDNPYILDFSTLTGVSGHNFGSFAVVAQSGHFGIGSIQYSTTAVPEPASALLLSVAGVGALRRRYRKARS